MTFSDISAIDAHGHYGTFPDSRPMMDEFNSATGAAVAERARACSVGLTIVSPFSGLIPFGSADAVAGNEAAFREVPATAGLLQYVIVNPLQPKTYDQARTMLKAAWCVAIKIHPEAHFYRIADHGEKLFAFFEEIGAPVMAHSGDATSLPIDFVPFADRHPRAKVLLAHLGYGAGDQRRADLQVRAVQAARHGNLWVDTSSSRSILPGLIEWAVKEIGADRVLFGSDTPGNHVALQRARIEAAEIPSQAKRLVLRDNALRFFNLDGIAPPPN